MFKALSLFILCFGILLGMIRVLLDAYGTTQTALDLFRRRGAAMAALGNFLTSRVVHGLLIIGGVGSLLVVQIGWLDRFRAPQPQVELSIDSIFTVGWDDAPTLIQILLKVRNTGPSTNLDDWRLEARWNGRDYPHRHRLGVVEGAVGAPYLPPIDEQLAAAEFRGSAAGYVFFIFPEELRKAMDTQGRLAPSVVYRLGVTDGNGRDWSTEISMAELTARGSSSSRGRQPIRR